MRRTTGAALLFACIAILLAAASAPNDFRFSILGDRTGDAEPGVYELVWKEVERLHPQLERASYVHCDSRFFVTIRRRCCQNCCQDGVGFWCCFSSSLPISNDKTT